MICLDTILKILYFEMGSAFFFLLRIRVPFCYRIEPSTWPLVFACLSVIASNRSLVFRRQ